MHRLDRKRLRRDLIGAGIAPRHVRRTIDELEDHYDDVVEQELEDGADRLTACQNALTRLGAHDDIVAAVKARPELQSWAFRFPRLAAVLYPLTFVALLPAAPVFIGYANANLVVRWTACLFLSGLVTAGILLFLQLAITLT
ncbi:MAG: hypothetical protein QNJ23_10900 [Woeseiaceae bacterium]|nr:hypothetical protein [Woeseiaceae bacterium]